MDVSDRVKAILYIGPQSELSDQIKAQIEQSERELAWEICDTVQQIPAIRLKRDYAAFVLDGRQLSSSDLLAFFNLSQDRIAPARILIRDNQTKLDGPHQLAPRPHPYLLDESRLPRFSIILERALEHRHLAQRLATISEIARAIASTFDLDQVFEILGTRLRTLIKFRKLSLRVLNEEDKNFDTWDIELRRNRPTTNIQKDVDLSPDETRVLRAVLDSEEVRILNQDIPQSMQMEGIAAYVLVPLMGSNGSNGILAVGFQKLNIQDETLEILQDLSVHMSIALQNARAYQQLEEAQNQLFRSEKLHVLGELAAGVAHDFNNLLSAILGRAQMLKIAVADEDMLRSINVIEQAALDGARTVARIQEYAKASAATDFKPISVDSLVSETVERAKGSVRAQSRKNLNVNVSLSCEATVLGNLSELRQVLTNLIFNAVDAMTNGGTLKIASGLQNEGKTAWFSVIDEGTGMDSAVLAKMFNPFFTTKGQNGTGLGLSVSNSIIERHRGNFEVESTVGEGTSVKVCLPTCDSSGEGEGLIDPRRHWSPTPVPPASKPNSSTARILVIDDDPTVSELIKRQLTKYASYNVVIASNGKDGLKVLVPIV